MTRTMIFLYKHEDIIYTSYVLENINKYLQLTCKKKKKKKLGRISNLEMK